MNPLTLLLLACCWTTMFWALPQDTPTISPNVTASVDRTDMQIADPFQLQVQVIAASESQVSFPEFDQRIGEFEILEFDDEQRNVGDEGSSRRKWMRTFTVETLETGDLEIPSIEVSVQTQDGDSQLLRTEPVKISVAQLVEANADLTKFNDIADLIDVEEPESPTSNMLWVTVTAGLALAAAAACLALAMRSPTYESSKTWALGRLESAGTDFLQVENILRGFLEERFELPAVSLGATALVRKLDERDIAPTAVAALEEILTTSERVKFGGSTLSPQENSRLFDQAHELIEQLSNEEVA